jgi:hypothetical protein
MVLALTACVETTAKTDQADDLAKISAVTVSSPDFAIKPGDSLSWRRDVIWVQGKDLPESARNINRQNLSAEIEHQLQAKGYRFVKGNQAADYEVIAAVILGKSEKGDALAELARLYPALGDSVHSLEKGTLMLGIARPGSKNLLWRSGIQAFIAEDPTVAQQRERLQGIVNSLLSTLP